VDLAGKQLASAGGDNVIRQWQLPAQADGALKPGKEHHRPHAARHEPRSISR
jgi:hypothetical protein